MDVKITTMLPQFQPVQMVVTFHTQAELNEVTRVVGMNQASPLVDPFYLALKAAGGKVS